MVSVGTSQDVDSVARAFKHRLETIAEAKQLLDTLNAQKPRPKEAVLLERRIKCCELAGLLHSQSQHEQCRADPGSGVYEGRRRCSACLDGRANPGTKC